MAILRFDAKDYLQTKVVEAAIYPTEISKIEGPTKSSSGKSSSYFVDFRITDGAYEGKTRTVAFNTGTNSPSLLGEMQFFPTAYFLILAQALGTDDSEPKNKDLDTDELMHQPFSCQWDIATVEGRLINTIGTFYKAGYEDKPAF